MIIKAPAPCESDCWGFIYFMAVNIKFCDDSYDLTCCLDSEGYICISIENNDGTFSAKSIELDLETAKYLLKHLKAEILKAEK